ncbi:hypothetical protein L9F63_024686 [Diploptera punctata]|uniref:Uncharacterized protein n=1 Tax=Diploptera punctata TaxID=6984 RepID=A0AAD8E6L2_DIPPU|nr:hypothetical protein L9F63_024686 [Diploptera punctata]
MAEINGKYQLERNENLDAYFKAIEEYEESMPSGETLKNMTTIEDGKIVTVSQVPDGSKTTRTYSFSEDGMLLTLVHEKSGETAKRHFKRLQ